MKETSAPVPAQATTHDAELVLDVVASMARELGSQRASRQSVDAGWHLERDVGLDSLGRMELLSRIEAATGWTLDEHAVMAAERVGDLLQCARIAPGAGHSPATGAVALRGEQFTGNPLDEPTLSDAFAWHVSHHPDRVHVHLIDDAGGQVPISYGDLQQRSGELAAGLVHYGINPGDTVAIMLPTGRTYLEVFLACLTVGAVPVPIYPPARPKQIEEHFRRHARILANAGTRVLITFQQVKQVSRLLAASVPGLEQLLTPEELSGQPALAIGATRKPDEIAFIQYTSGSTGDPKGVVLTHGNIMASLSSMAQALDAKPSDVFVSWLPLYHDMGLIGAWLGAMVVGFPLVLMSPLTFLARPRRWLEAIDRFGGTISGGPNFAYELCTRRIEPGEDAALDLSSWRLAFNGAEPVNADTMQQFAERFAPAGFGARAMTPVYGLAEATLGVAFTPAGRGPLVTPVSRQALSADGVARAARDDEEVTLCVSSGVPIPSFEVRIVSARGTELPDRSEGSIEFCGPGASAGYYRNAAATAELKHGEWWGTGDRGFILDGELYITGRDKDVVIRAGRNLYPYALEQAVADVPGIRRGCVAVIGARDPRNGTESLVVIAESRDHAGAAAATMREAIEALAVEHIGMAVDEVVIAPPHTVLKTSSGKIRRAALAERYASGTLLEHTPRALWLQLASLGVTSVLPIARRALSRVRDLGYTLWCGLALVAVVTLTWPAVVVASDRAAAWRRAGRGARALFALAGVRLKRIGQMPDAGAGRVIICNHQSYLDSLVLVALLDIPVRFVAKRELTSFAPLRHFLQALGVLFVDRFDRHQAVSDAGDIAKAVRDGDAVMFFPEGTFHRMAGLLPFQLGAFETALTVGVDVVPVVIRGTRHILRGDDVALHRGDATVEVLDPIAVTACEPEQRWAAAVNLRSEARARILTHCHEPDLSGHAVRTRLTEGA